MNIEELIRAWKAEEQEPDQILLENPVGNELSDKELAEVVGCQWDDVQGGARQLATVWIGSCTCKGWGPNCG